MQSNIKKKEKMLLGPDLYSSITTQTVRGECCEGDAMPCQYNAMDVI